MPTQKLKLKIFSEWDPWKLEQSVNDFIEKNKIITAELSFSTEGTTYCAALFYKETALDEGVKSPEDKKSLRYFMAEMTQNEFDVFTEGQKRAPPGYKLNLIKKPPYVGISDKETAPAEEVKPIEEKIVSRFLTIVSTEKGISQLYDFLKRSPHSYEVTGL